MMTEAGVPFVIMTTATFLRHVKTYLNFDVASETIDQAKELPGAFDVEKRMLAARQEQLRMTLMEIRIRREYAAKEAGMAAARERDIQSAIERGGNDGNPAEKLRGELEARRTDRMAAETQLASLMKEDWSVQAQLEATEKAFDFSDLSDT